MPAPIPWEKPCLRVGVVSTPDGLSWLHSLPGVCDIVELRVDRLLRDGISEAELGQAIESAAPPVLLTFRAETEGGAASAAEVDRFSLLARLARPGTAIDFEYASVASRPVRAPDGAKTDVPLVLSSHFFGRELDGAQVEAHLALMRRLPARIYKIVSLCNTESTLESLERVQRRHRDDVALMGTGALAAESRRRLPLAGARMVYGYLDAATAPGQPPASELMLA